MHESSARKAPSFLAAAGGAWLLALAGCASGPPPSYDLHAAAALAPARAHIGRAVSVDLPDAATPLDSDLVVVREGDRLNSLAGAQWADRLTLLVQSRVIESFEHARSRSAGPTDSYRLALYIRRFDIDAVSRLARVEIAARVADDGGRVVSAKIFSASEPVVQIAGAEPPQALDRAFSRLLPQIVAWASGR